jgi:hypothetical protein
MNYEQLDMFPESGESSQAIHFLEDVKDFEKKVILHELATKAITMAQHGDLVRYDEQNFSEIEVHELFFRRAPYKGNNFAVAVGMPYALRFLKAKVTEGDAEWLIAQGFTKDFVNYLVSQSTDLFKGVNIWSVINLPDVTETRVSYL